MRVWRRFLFTRSEMLGVISLAAAIILIRVFAVAIPLATIEPPDPELLEEIQQQLPKDQPTSMNSNRQLPTATGSTFDAPARPKSSRQHKSATKKIVEINGADTILLEELTGIGPSFARRIAKYRNMLGGYIAKEQLLQVYGMDSARYQQFVDEIRIDTSLITRLNVNLAAFKDLLRHPYLDFEQVKAICNYRDRKGGIGELSELWTAGVLPDSLQKWLEPYLKTQ
ncbi:MAG: helix-hairpin-helix domain-containing protein [Bacteroidales bacterium]|jgi:DNA uptake protein ComE-like DNA-binding protein|nr:helix-hairpin-helix domain-containing protein [Bacteroidales bacterium]MDD2570222.1 helix-hairpin-helix domain-containing protein [Bacteroidales bacterium]MDD3811704.1 helix-hairpin-helix domain-containing protein [Bacteroidales bacterium]MDD4812471.1 helix-hairpin-helix domain-containing protein [Bacteroidales bacterium]NLO68478.1 helix-hairpin-helix domain-containing protein [Bacteroidales bacterium]